MARCEDCVHYDVCKFVDEYNPAYCDEYKPTADVVEVKHGKWNGKPLAGRCTVRCSICGSAFLGNDGRWKYCPDCGAKMDKE